MSRISPRFELGPELNSGWCQYASAQRVRLAASVVRTQAACAESAPAAMLLLSDRWSARGLAAWSALLAAAATAALVTLPITGWQAIASRAMGAAALGAMAVGAIAIGKLAIGALRVRKAHISKLRIDELEVGKITIVDREGD